MALYAQVSDVTNRYPNRDLVQLTNEDPAATSVNATVVQQALQDASDEIDGYLTSRYQLPLSDPPAVLNRVCCDIAMYRMQALRPLHDLEEARKRYEDAISWLTKVGTGKLDLGLSSDLNTQAPEATESVMSVGGPREDQPRMFSRDRLKVF